MSIRKTGQWFYIPTLYCAEAIPYGIVTSVSVVMYKTMGMSNEFIGFTSLLYFPWVIKMLWSPLVDLWGTQRRWILCMQWVLVVLFGLLALSFFSDNFLWLSLVVLCALALCGATNDVATDGYYLVALDTKEQAFFIGVRSTFYRLGLIFSSGGLVMLAGYIEENPGTIASGWTCVMGICSAVFALFACFHHWYLPRAVAHCSGCQQRGGQGFYDAFRTYFQQPRIGIVLAFILVYRLGEALLLKMTAPFLLDRPEAGGLGLATDTVGFVYGTVGVMGLCCGGILGGWAIARWGLARCLWPMALMLNVPNLFYVYLAAVRPGLLTVVCLVTAEQIGYGFGFSAFAVFLMNIAREPYQTSHFALSTGFMALGMMVPGMLSGFIQHATGYFFFFVIVVIAGLPGLVLLPFLPVANAPR